MGENFSVEQHDQGIFITGRASEKTREAYHAVMAQKEERLGAKAYRDAGGDSKFACFKDVVVTAPLGKGLVETRLLVNTDDFVVDDEHFEDLIPAFTRHEAEESYKHAKPGYSLLGKEKAEAMAHKLAIREQWRYAFEKNQAGRLLDFLGKSLKTVDEKKLLKEYEVEYALERSRIINKKPEKDVVEITRNESPDNYPSEIYRFLVNQIGETAMNEQGSSTSVKEKIEEALKAIESGKLPENFVEDKPSSDEKEWIRKNNVDLLGQRLLKWYKSGHHSDAELSEQIELDRHLAKAYIGTGDVPGRILFEKETPISGKAIPMAAPLLGNPAVMGDTKARSLISGYNSRLDPSTETMSDLVRLQESVLDRAGPAASAVILPAIDAVFANPAEVQRLNRNERAKLAFTPEFPQNPEQLISLVREQLYRFELQTGSADMPGSWEKRIHFRNDPYGQNGRSLLEYFDDPSSPLAAITGRAWHYSSEGEMKHTTVGEMLKNEIRARERLKIRWELWNQNRAGMGGYADIKSILGPSREAALSQHIEPLASMLPNDANPAGRLLGDGVSLAFDAYRRLARDQTFDGGAIVNIFSRNRGAKDGQPWNDGEVKALRERVRVYVGGDPQAELLGYRLAQVWGEAAWGDHFPKQEAQGGAGNQNSDHTSRLMRFFERIHRKKMGADASRDQMPPSLLLPFLQETRLKITGLPEMTMAEALNGVPGRLLRHLPWNKLADPVSDETWANSIEAAAKIFAIATSKELAFKGQDDFIKALINVSDCVNPELTAGALAEVVDLGLAGFRVIPLQETLKKATNNVENPPTDPITGALNPAFQPVQRKPLSWWLATADRKKALEKTQKEWQHHFRYWIIKGQLRQSGNSYVDFDKSKTVLDAAIRSGFINTGDVFKI